MEVRSLAGEEASVRRNALGPPVGGAVVEEGPHRRHDAGEGVLRVAGAREPRQELLEVLAAQTVAARREPSGAQELAEDLQVPDVADHDLLCPGGKAEPGPTLGEVPEPPLRDRAELQPAALVDVPPGAEGPPEVPAVVVPVHGRAVGQEVETVAGEAQQADGVAEALLPVGLGPVLQRTARLRQPFHEAVEVLLGQAGALLVVALLEHELHLQARHAGHGPQVVADSPARRVVREGEHVGVVEGRVREPGGVPVAEPAAAGRRRETAIGNPTETGSCEPGVFAQHPLVLVGLPRLPPAPEVPGAQLTGLA